MSSLKTPPVLSDDVNYQDWKTDLQVWEQFTELEPKRKGPALYLSLPEKSKVRECVRELTAARIGSEEDSSLYVRS